MFNQNAIITCLKSLIGVAPHSNNDYPEISDELQVSESGLVIQQLHPLLSIENLYNCSQDIVDEDFVSYLEKRRETAIVKLMSNLYTAKHLNENSRELLTEVKMYEGVGNYSDLIVKQNRFVGYRIENIGKDLSLLIRHIGLQLDKVNPDFKLYIYKANGSTPTVVDIAHNKVVSFVWFNFDAQYLQSGTDYLIGYYESDLVGQAIKKEQYLTKEPKCSTCNASNLALYQKWSKFLSIRPFYVNSDDLNEDKTKWEESAEIYSDGNNWGLNLAISVICDVSGLFCRNRELFVDALGKQIVVEFLQDMIYSTRDNQLKQKLFQSALYAMGDNQNPGAKHELEKAIKALNFSTSDMNTICLPCQDESYRINYRSVY